MAAAVLAVGFFTLRGLWAPGGAVEVTVHPIKRQTVQNILSVSGPVSGTESAYIASNLNAKIKEIYVKEGERVAAGQVLALLDDGELQKEIELAENTYRITREEYKEQALAAQSGYAQAQEEFDAASEDLRKVRALFAAGGASDADLRNARKSADLAAIKLGEYRIVAGEALPAKSYELRVENARLAWEKQREGLGQTRLKSPISGTVVRVNARVGQYADQFQEQKPMIVVENLDELEMKIQISEYSIGKVAVGQPVAIRAEILATSRASGVVARVSPTGEEKGPGSAERVIPITVRILDTGSQAQEDLPQASPERGDGTQGVQARDDMSQDRLPYGSLSQDGTMGGKLTAGITAKADIVLEEEKDALAVPVSAITWKGDDAFIAVAQGDVARLIPVKIGVEGDLEVAVSSGTPPQPQEGMLVVTNPPEGIEDGMRIEYSLETGT